MNVLLLVLGLVLGVAVGAVLGYFVYRSRVDSRQTQARSDAASIIQDAEREAETKRREVHAPIREIMHRRHADETNEPVGQC